MPSKKLEVPEELYDVFMQFLDISQASFTEEAVAEMTEVEQQLFKFLEQLLGEDRVYRYKTAKELNEAKSTFAKIMGIQCQ